MATSSEGAAPPGGEEDDSVANGGLSTHDDDIVRESPEPSKEVKPKRQPQTVFFQPQRPPDKLVYREDICGRAPCKNIWIFVAAYTTLLLLSSVSDHYLTNIAPTLGIRYTLKRIEQYFIPGVGKVGFLMTLVLAAYFCTVGHKPHVMFAGSVLSAVGIVISCLPYGVYETPNENFNTYVYHQTALCLSRHNSSIPYHQQCGVLTEDPLKGKAFSLLCLGQFVFGVGMALYSTVGLAYIVENVAALKASLLLGIVMCMEGIGRALGISLAVSISPIASIFNGAVTTFEEVSGRWPIPLGVFAALFVCAGIPLIFFPRWFEEPDWLQKLRARAERKRRLRNERLAKLRAKQKARRARQQREVARLAAQSREDNRTRAKDKAGVSLADSAGTNSAHQVENTPDVDSEPTQATDISDGDVTRSKDMGQDIGAELVIPPSEENSSLSQITGDTEDTAGSGTQSQVDEADDTEEITEAEDNPETVTSKRVTIVGPDDDTGVDEFRATYKSSPVPTRRQKPQQASRSQRTKAKKKKVPTATLR